MVKSVAGNKFKSKVSVMKKRRIHKLDIVIPVFNEAEGIGLLYDLLIKELVELNISSYEMILINDGSTDNTESVLNKLNKSQPNVVKVLNLTRNFGKEAALSAGLHYSTGDCVMTMDADGQHPPSKIHEFLQAFQEGNDMVVGMRMLNADEKNIKKIGNSFYYRLLKLSGIGHLQPRVTDFRAMSREVVDEFCKLTERRRITRGLLDWMGFQTTYVEFDAPERMAGKATYNFKKLAYLAIDSILSNSRKPLVISFAAGIFMSVTGLLGALFIGVESYLLNDPLNLNLSGASLLILMALFMIGLVLISQGIASLYLARIYEEAQQRPLYIIDRSRSLASQTKRERTKQ